MPRNGWLIWGWLAIFLASSSAWPGQWGIKISDPPNREGALIVAVTPGGPADIAGIQQGDVITYAEDRKVQCADDLASLLRSLPDGQKVTMMVLRQGWEKSMTLTPSFSPLPSPAYVEQQGSLPSYAPFGRPSPVATGPLKATISVGDFQVKALNANQYIGDGLREMLLTALHNTGRFAVMERIDIQGIAAEQALSRSSLARPETAIPNAQMEVADVMIFGAVTEFEGEAGGSDFNIGMPSAPFSASRGGKTSHMAIDVRVVDVASGRLLLAERIASSADSSKGGFGATPTVSGKSLPFSFGAFRNTPMEKAIRDAVIQATQYVSNNLPPAYFRHP